MTEKYQSIQRRTCPCATLSTTNPTRTGTVSKPPLKWDTSN